ncbi:adhesion G-protein coupled receptor G6 isoform X1 [Oreochromis niloticus]|uniref:adhesion G-protein coupled receptor G6 isoform X1 n=1 Tax=Oreochromis niloticus TaxID=8128 RepID=UPI0009059246|nr:adhesion G-protein coupled receptor G6 isoform X1 [Oreochromis niloticus]
METFRGEGGGGRGGRWRLRHVVLVVLLWMTLHRHVLGCASTNCNLVLTESQGEITSPCYPQRYPNSYNCRWIMKAPAGFIIQLSFLDFELEEAPGCIYDWVKVNTGSAEVVFCGLTANGLTQNSTGNEMVLSFTSDFSVQKKGFRVSFQHVAVALRNQKIKMSSGVGQITKVANSVSIPALSQLTICFEVERISLKQKEWIFTYSNNSSAMLLSLGSDGTGMKMVVDGVVCPIDNIILPSDFTYSMKSFCVLWTSSNGRVAVYFNGNYWAKACSSSTGHSVQAGGEFRIGNQQQSFDGNIYNLRLWDYAMSIQQLGALKCESVGNVIDWDNSYWAIPASLAQTDTSLSCICYPHCIYLTTTAPASGVFPVSNAPLNTNCDSPALGCPAVSSPATSSTDSTNTIHTTNANTHVLSTITPSPSIPSTRMPLTSIISTTTTAATSPSSSVLPNTTITTTTRAPTSASTDTNVSASSRTAHAQQPTSSTAAVSSFTTNHPDTNPTLHETSGQLQFMTTNQPETNIAVPAVSSWEEQFYQFKFVVDDSRSQTTRETLKSAVALWLNQTFENWIHKVYVGNISVQLRPETAGNLSSYECRGLLVNTDITNESLSLIDDASARLRQGSMAEGMEIQSASVEVKLIENCPRDSHWPETRPTVTRYQPCFLNKKWRTCLISSLNYSSYWSDPNSSNCTDIDSIQVSAENASDVAEQLKAFTNNKLNETEVSKVVSKVEQLVNVAKINITLASSIVTIISNVMIGSATVPSASDKALKTMDELVQKIQFDGPSIQINSKNLAVGILALNTTTFNKTTLGAFMSPNKSDPQIDFNSKSEQLNPLAQVTLPASLLSNVSHAEPDTLSRISFMFFSSPSFFQKKEENELISYVVATSVGNFSIHNLMDPVRIEITHRSEQASENLVCVFWDFKKNDGTGGWNKEGCTKNSTYSTANKTVCECDHLTHFGVLLDISRTSASIDEKNNKILTYISNIGCGISAIFSAATLLTYIAFEKLRRDYPSKILMNLSTSLLFLNMVFLLDSWLSTMENDGLCLAVAIFLHYFLLTSFTWMGLESVHMYIALVKVFNTYIRRYILKFCIVGWGLPAALVGIVAVVDKGAYKAEEHKGGSKFCWITNETVFYTTCVGYFCLVFLLNLAMFVVVMLQICGRNGKRSNRTLREEVLRNLRSAISLTFLLGMTWGFAFFAWGPVKLTFMYLFSIFNSLQGLFIFIFHCALKENVQKQWRRYLCCGRFKLSDNSDWSKTATNNTKKVSSDNLGKSLSSSSFGSTTANWTSKAKATLNPFKRHSNTAKCYSKQTNPKCISSSCSSSEVEPNSSSSSSSILPVSQMIDKVKGYCSTHSDNFCKNIIMPDTCTHCTRF